MPSKTVVLSRDPQHPRAKTADAFWRELAEDMHYATEHEMIDTLYWYFGYSTRKIGRIIGFCAEAIIYRMIRLGIPRKGCAGANNTKRNPKAKYWRLLELNTKNMTVPEIMGKTGLSQKYIWKILADRKLPYRRLVK